MQSLLLVNCTEGSITKINFYTHLFDHKKAPNLRGLFIIKPNLDINYFKTSISGAES